MIEVGITDVVTSTQNFLILTGDRPDIQPGWTMKVLDAGYQP